MQDRSPALIAKSADFGDLPAPLVFVSKSAWEPAVRREHAWAQLAARHGHPVTFVERPVDIRALRQEGAQSWLGGLRGSPITGTLGPPIDVIRRTTPVPGHRSLAAGKINAALLRGVLSRYNLSRASIVVSWPWDWPAVSRSGAARLIFDMADDWGELIPGRSARFATLYERVAQEADEIIVVNQSLIERFPGRRPIVVRNGLDAKTVADGADRATSTSDGPQMTYLGTLSPRFDVDLVRRVLDLLPDWRLQLIGPAMYPGLGARPSPELTRLIQHDRVIWHGPLERAAAMELAARSEVAIVPHRHDHALGQDSMKFYDYAGAGIPIVSTGWFDPGLDVPPLLGLGDSPEAFAFEVTQLADADRPARATQREWAAENTWESRWPQWSRTVFGASRTPASDSK